jgi:hypothetical protein
MWEDTKPDRDLATITTQRRSTPSWMIANFEMDSTIQTIPYGPCKDATETEIVAEMCIPLTGYRVALDYLGEMEGDELYSEQNAQEFEWAGSRGKGRPCSSDEPEGIPLFPPRFAQAGEGSLPGEVRSPRDASGWIISAPLIEKYIRRLYAKNRRVPAGVELEAALGGGTFYRDILAVLKDLEINMIHLEAKQGGERMAYLSDRSEGDVLLSCVRSEMLELFRSAVSNLPRMERLTIALDYDGWRYGKRITLTLDSPDSEVGGDTRILAYLSVQASLPDPDLGQTRPRVGCLLPELSDDAASEEARKNARIRASENWDVRVRGSQSGLLPRALSREWGGDEAGWTQDFTSWYCLDNEHNLNRVRREENYHLNLEI